MSVLEIRGLSKSFFGYPALRNVDLEIRAGEVHGLVGENGAGKSTLMKILAGVYTRDSGTISLAGTDVDFTHPVQAYAAGISTVFQEFNLIAERTVAENIYLGREPRMRGFVSRREMTSRTQELLRTLGVESISPTTRVRELSVAQQQIVEIAKALSYDAQIISMDEPTAALADHEVELLYGIIARLTDRGVSILYVSHRMREIFHLCDRITVLKDGELVATRPTSEFTEHDLVRLMVGRSLSALFPQRRPETTKGDVALSLTAVGNGSVDDITLELCRGEIVGMAGLQGSGRTEVLQGISGAVPFSRGTVVLNGAPVRLRHPKQAITRGVAHITEDRKATGLALNQSVLDNALAVVRATRPGQAAAARRRATELFLDLELSARGPDQEVKFLSGGNQQKVVLAKWLLASPQVILLDEPTRGIDVGARHALYNVIRQLAAAGHAILMVSSELPELIGMADRILVMHDGRLAADLPAGSSEETILRAASGVTESETAA
ncbi:MAG: sugar transporter ATP-binding protein [Microbacteriaceae bacterium]|nr:sugar transporter ATP-binding protein [Microbacteriaceae bacterium]